MVLSVVYSGETDGGTKPLSVDIVAVHGLGGDKFTTWTSRKTQACWLRDWLPHELNDARIMTFGYNTALAFGRSTADITDYAKELLSDLIDKREDKDDEKRPIIFIAHSLGGIVVKQALFQASIEPRYKSISERTIGIMFFGTPHRGSEKATYGKVLASIANTVAHKPSSRMLNALQTNSDTLMRLTSDFRFQLPRYQIYSFFEQLPMKPFSGLIVEKNSALLEADIEEQIPVNADHHNICKFDNPEDATYEKVHVRIRRMMKARDEVLSHELSFHNQHFEVPHPVSSVFTGRKDILNRLHDLCLPASPGIRIQKRFVLYGLGGSGKTQICLKYAQENRERYWGIFWIDISSAQNAKTSFFQIADSLGLEKDFNSVKRWFSNTPKEWLLIFDNADNPKLDLSKFFPAGDRGTVLITSRNPECANYGTVGSDKIDQMMLDEAVALLLRTICGQDRLQKDERAQAETVVVLLDCFALAIVQAGAYIRQSLCTLKEYPVLYETSQKHLMSHRPIHSSTDYQETVFTTWEISLNMIETMQNDAADYAIELLQLFSFCHNETISEKIFLEAWRNDEKDEGSFKSHLLSRGIPDQYHYQLLLREAISILSSFSLIKRDTDESVSFHRLVYDWTRNRLTQPEKEAKCLKASATLAWSTSLSFESADFSFRRLLLPHVDACVRFQKGLFQGRRHEREYEMNQFALIFSEDGRFSEALELTEQVVELQTKRLGDKHSDTLITMVDLANRYSENGRFLDALTVTEQVLELRKSSLGNEHPDTLSSRSELAIRYSEIGRRQEALLLIEQVVELRKRVLGDEHRLTLASMSNLATSCGEVGRHQDALVLIKQVIELQKKRLGDDHPDTLASINTLAVSYSHLGRPQKALELTEYLVEFRKGTLGSEHPNTLSLLGNLAIYYGEVGRHQEALLLTEHAVELQKRRLGDEHPKTLVSMSNLAIRYCEVGRRQEALLLWEKVVDLQKRWLGDEHPSTLSSVNNLRRLKSDLQKSQDVVPSRSHSRFRKLFRHTH